MYACAVVYCISRVRARDACIACGGWREGCSRDRMAVTLVTRLKLEFVDMDGVPESENRSTVIVTYAAK